jgi:hypothetical protein
MADAHVYSLTIAETTVEVVSIDAGMALGLGGTQQRFQAGDARPDMRIEAAFGHTALPRDPLIFDANGVWKVYCRNGSFHFTCNSPGYGPLPYKTAHFNDDFSHGKVIIHRAYFPTAREADPLEWPLDELLMGHLLGLGKGVEMHAAGLIDAQGRGHLFIGHSGAGKSTMTRLWEKEPGVMILSDDRIILRVKEGTFRMYGTPWHGDARHASPASAPVFALYVLEHGDATRLTRLPAAQASVRLFTRSIPAFYSRDAVAFTLGFINRLVEAVPCFQLPFVPDKRVVDLVLGSHPVSSATMPQSGRHILPSMQHFFPSASYGGSK